MFIQKEVFINVTHDCMCIFPLPSFQLKEFASHQMNMAVTGDGKQDKTTNMRLKKTVRPFLLHHWTWFKLKTDFQKGHPPSSPHAQLHPQQSISFFRYIHHPFSHAISKQMESLGQIGGKQITGVRVRGNYVHLNKQYSAWVSRSTEIWQRMRGP